MREIRLDLDAVTVDSFAPDVGRAKGVGTVRGHDITQLAGCPVPSEFSNCATCLGGCPRETLTCYASCLMTNGYQVCKEPYC